MIARLGVIGVGELGEAIVTGLSSAPSPPDIQLSPRSATAARALAGRFQNVRVHPDNQAVVDHCDAVLLTVPPASAETALAAIRVPRDRLLISAVAGWSRARLSRCLPDQPEVVRVIPLPSVREQRGVTAVFPRNATTEATFSQVGDVVVSDSEDLFSALSAATATISSHLSFLAAVSTWLERQGWSADAAERFVRTVFSGVGSGLTDHSRSLSELIGAHETPQGINESLRQEWLTPANRAGLEQALTNIHDRVRPVEENQR